MELLEVVRLPEFAERKPTQLSGGQQQRIALARALVNLPKALLLDEPLGALDLKLRQVMQLELKRIQREVGITFIFVTHDQEEALTMSDRIAVMTQGRIDQIGTPTEIYHRPSSVFVAGFIGTANLLPGHGARPRTATRVTVDSPTRQPVPVPGRRHAPTRRHRRHPDGPTRAPGAGRRPLHGGEPAGTHRGTVTSLVFQGPVVRCQVPHRAPAPTWSPTSGPRTTRPASRSGSPITMTWAYDGAYLVPEAIDADMAGVTSSSTTRPGAGRRSDDRARTFPTTSTTEHHRRRRQHMANRVTRRQFMTRTGLAMGGLVPRPAAPRRVR